MNYEITRAPLKPALDQPTLYATGVEHIRMLAGKVWSDHNVHDPGVTAIELLSFVLTDLSYRAQLRMEDLLAVDGDNVLNMRNQFPTARTVLTCRPVTVRDYRKLLIDLPGVRNAWLKPADLTYYADREAGKLLLNDPGLENIVPVHVRGLYDVRIDFTDTVDTPEAKALVLRRVRATLQANRNLCEDFLEPQAIERQAFQICGELELQPGREVDVSAVQAEIFFQVQNYLAPSVKNYSLAELQQPSDEIFDGPALNTGFIKDKELDETDLRTEIRLSDIINIVMDVPGVRAVRDFLITPAGAPPLADKWVVPVLPDHQPTLERAVSRLVYYKSGMPVTPVSTKVEEQYSLRMKEATLKLEVDRRDDREIPIGRYRHLDRYYSFQNHFPVTYGLGEEGLEPTVGPRRQALAKQLKGYLLFFDQIMADFCAQLDRIRELFSNDPAIEGTYFYQAVDTLREYADIYDVTVPTTMTGQAAADEAKRQALTLLTASDVDEAVSIHVGRRHRFLDHLIARYAERFHDYTAAVHAAIGTSDRALQRHKCRFLQAYPRISSERGLAYDYTEGPFWDSQNVSGLERRLCMLLDMANCARRNLSSAPTDANSQVFLAQPGEYRFRITDPASGGVLLRSPFGYATQSAAREAMTGALEAAQVPGGYQRHVEADGTRSFAIVDETGQVVALSDARFKTSDELERAIDDCLEYIRGNYAEEGLYVIEHLLLRTTKPSGLLLPICVDTHCTDCADDDPYSYRVHVILSAEAGRFNNMEFRRFAEQVIRAETPAHILPKICWIGVDDMRRLEKAYHEWIDLGPTAQTTDKLNTLIEVLFSVKNVYPQARLVCCDCQEGGPKFLLGQKALGTGHQRDDE